MCRLRDKSIHLDSGVKPRNDKLIEQVPNPALSYHPVPLGHPSNGVELNPRRGCNKFPSVEGWHEVPGWSITQSRGEG